MSVTDAIDAALDYLARATHVAMPAIVESYDASTQTCSVQPAILRTVVDDDAPRLIADKFPVLGDVPVCFPRGGDMQITMPVKQGDTVLLVFCDQSIDAWQASDGTQQVTPRNARVHHISDAVAIPGVWPAAKALSGAKSDRIVVGQDGGIRVEVDPGAGVVNATSQGSGNGQDFVAMAEKTNTRIAALEQAFNTFVTAYNAHTHISNGPSAATTPPASPGLPVTPGSSVASSTLKADN